MQRIGFMQGRLSPIEEGRVQSFPWKTWEDEFVIGSGAGFELIEWTLDADRLRENPLLLDCGRERIRTLSKQHGIGVQSLTGDCFMQNPFWKAPAEKRSLLVEDLRAILEACASLGVRHVVIPLVDNGSVKTKEHRESLLDVLVPLTPWLSANRIAIVFESDFGPKQLEEFVAALRETCFGINYDIGNSASLGFDPVEEIRRYGSRIMNVHVKDRLKGGTTVALGQGSADFETVFRELARARYDGDFILQTARAVDNNHLSPLVRYRNMVQGWIRRG